MSGKHGVFVWLFGKSAAAFEILRETKTHAYTRHAGQRSEVMRPLSDIAARFDTAEEATAAVVRYNAAWKADAPEVNAAQLALAQAHQAQQARAMQALKGLPAKAEA